MLLLAEILHENLSEWHMVLAPQGKHGKGRFITRLVTFINENDHQLLRNKSTTSETFSSWIKIGKEFAEKEQARKDEIKLKGRGAENEFQKSFHR